MKNKAIFKYNSGNLALLCSKCSKIIKEGKDFDEYEMKAYQGKVTMTPQFCDTCVVYDSINAHIYSFKTKYLIGFLPNELQLVKDYYLRLGMNEDKFENALRGITCQMQEGKLVIYHCDIVNAIHAGLENRELNINEWD